MYFLLFLDENMFVKGLDQFTDGVEREELVFNVQGGYLQKYLKIGYKSKLLCYTI